MPSQAADDESIAAKITCIISDVDGVMTDGQIWYDSAGVETKSFHVRDGLAIKRWLQVGHKFGILTARTSPVVDRRAAELGVAPVAQGVVDKWPCAEQMIATWGCDASTVCYIGDDLPDLAVMNRVGLSAAPADAADDVIATATWVLQRAGGRGAVRALIERLLQAQQRWTPQRTMQDGQEGGSRP